MAANLLWAHLLRKDATMTSDTLSQIPPIVPQDKTGTSMRMLIHDTQVNLEKFSTRLDGLLQRVDDCRAEVANANKLLDVERDKVLTEILEIAHRCQTEMKAHVGAPAQATALELAHASLVSTERSVQALEKRIDALQALLQAHATAMQSIQEQQNTLIGTLLPLVPIFQGVAPQMDQIKAALSDVVANAVSTLASRVDNVRSSLVSEFAQVRSSLSKSTTGSRRTRPNTSLLAPRETDGFPSSPLDSRRHEGPRPNLKRARIEGTTLHEELPRKMSRLARTPSLRTPRQPLVDLPLDTSKIRTHMPDYMRTLDTRWTAIPGSTSRSNFYEHPRPPLQDITRAATPHDVLASAGPSGQDALSKAAKTEEVLGTMPIDVISVHSSPLSSAPSHHSMQQNLVLVEQPGSPPKPMSLRDRRAQMSRFGRTETRRFIPMVPWSDEEE